jgi:hypothetical protein
LIADSRRRRNIVDRRRNIDRIVAGRRNIDRIYDWAPQSTRPMPSLADHHGRRSTGRLLTAARHAAVPFAALLADVPSRSTTGRSTTG